MDVHLVFVNFVKNGYLAPVMGHILDPLSISKLYLTSPNIEKAKKQGSLGGGGEWLSPSKIQETARYL